MQLRLLALLFVSLLISRQAKSEGGSPPPAGNAGILQSYPATGIVQEIRTNAQMVVIKHEAISNYMDAMTMPFKVKSAAVLAGLRAGDEITFQLHVTETESWVDQIKKIGIAAPVFHPARDGTPQRASPVADVSTTAANPLLFYEFTNELGQAVSLNDFHGQALGITFFYTRCPLPDYCPRLSKNFEEASQRLAAMTNAPSDWHFISITFDPAHDTPAMLKAYGESYHYDPKHWSFLTGPPDKIAELAKACGVEYTPGAGAITHNFRTLIVDAAGHLQMVFPMTGDFSDSIVDQMLKAAAVKPEMTKP
jgi:protein SCO1/2